MASCDCCGKDVDERSMEMVGHYFVCQACVGYYDEAELIEEIEGRIAERALDRARRG